MAEITPKTRKRNGTRRSYQKDFERLSFYLSTVIRIKDEVGDHSNGLSDHVKGELKAYRDIADYIAPKKAQS